METPRLDAALLDRYLTGEVTPDERIKVETWLAASSDAGGVVQALLGLDRGVDQASGQPRDYASLEALRATIRQRALSLEATGAGAKVRFAEQGTGGWGTGTLRGWALALGAATALIAAVAVVRLGSPPTSGTTRSYVTAANQQGIVTLSDGTRVTLAPQTTLRLLSFGTQHRMVTVEGKAYFEVTHAAGAPFEVQNGSVTTRVLGTAFLVDHASGSARVRVAVEEGKVRVRVASRANADFTITAGYVGQITDSSATVNPVVDSTSGTEWLRGNLVFHRMPVATVLQTLNRWYGYQFRCADPALPQRNVTIVISVRSPASALATLEQILRVNLSVTGDTVTLTPHLDGRDKQTPNVRSYDLWTPTREVGR